jgi:hypothetical protein
MRCALLIAASLFSIFAAAFESALIRWDDLEVGTKYRLLSDINFPEGFALQKDRGLILKEVSGGTGAIYFEFSNAACSDKKIKTETLFISDSVGVEMHENCIVGMWVMAQNYFDLSILAR